MLKWIWLAVIILAMLIEAAGPQVVSIWFAVGGLAAFVSSLLNAPLWLQLVIFVTVSIIALFVTKPLVKKLRVADTQATNADRYIGMTGRVTTEINEITGTGRVLVGGNSWSAKTKNGSIIPEGTMVKVEAIEGVKLIVHPAE
ncbi:MAG: NfeD family protein [Clostridia bacterium]|nr:NfeD family protein [Clostridia bacterium]